MNLRETFREVILPVLVVLLFFGAIAVFVNEEQSRVHRLEDGFSITDKVTGDLLIVIPKGQNYTKGYWSDIINGSDRGISLILITADNSSKTIISERVESITTIGCIDLHLKPDGDTQWVYWMTKRC